LAAYQRELKFNSISLPAALKQEAKGRNSTPHNPLKEERSIRIVSGKTPGGEKSEGRQDDRIDVSGLSREDTGTPEKLDLKS